MQDESYQEKKEKKYYLKLLEEKLVFIIAIPLIAVLITAMVFHFYRVDGTSMQNTFQDRDLLLVEKLGKSGSLIFRNEYIPKRYDVIVFKEPDFSDEELVKRVVGVPGDEVRIKNNQAVVYNSRNPGGIKVDDNMPAGTKLIKETEKMNDLDVKVAKDEIFVLGDNRPGSADSRFYGQVKTKNITGRVIVRLLPFKDLWIL